MRFQGSALAKVVTQYTYKTHVIKLFFCRIKVTRVLKYLPNNFVFLQINI